jgi:hypothetical protein
MAVTVPDEFFAAAQMTELELKRELALTLFQQERLTLAQASRLAGVSYRDFSDFSPSAILPSTMELRNSSRTSIHSDK